MGSNNRDVVLLLIRAELPDLFNNRINQDAGGTLTTTAQDLHQTWFSELFCITVRRFCHAIGVEQKSISGKSCRSSKRPITVQFESRCSSVWSSRKKSAGRCPQFA